MPPLVRGDRRYDAAGNRFCTACKAYLPADQFGRNAAIKDGLHIYCKACNTAKGLVHYHRDPATANRKAAERGRRWRVANPEKSLVHYAKHRERATAWKRQVIAGYGGACACCGEDTFEFLSVDHVNNDGNGRRKEGTGYSLYRRIVNAGFPADYQVLCYNCNLAKGFFGECPHQRTKE